LHLSAPLQLGPDETQAKLFMTVSEENPKQKKHERNTFVFLAVFLAPILSVILVGSLGFAIWISQIFFGPPST
jgi:nitrate reductase NapE